MIKKTTTSKIVLAASALLLGTSLVAPAQAATINAAPVATDNATVVSTAENYVGAASNNILHTDNGSTIYVNFQYFTYHGLPSVNADSITTDFESSEYETVTKVECSVEGYGKQVVVNATAKLKNGTYTTYSWTLEFDFDTDTYTLK
ncbi:hypothetical protein D2E26_0268 [Bifidobacterium dolichotidis]|uniref:Uncharacterized protein n=1 Tax=Bifidobacterium dolichotidis TaxID=2306976 RepID=A0A430FS63_9BIFI|nr:hypothetical protein [Bifidobacterium dolichotidis]RSX55705.1 hypothetical protein D2E26_0268 [Bifidobacterium dolichotidis]